MYPHLHLLKDASANDSRVFHSQTCFSPVNIIAISLCHTAIFAVTLTASVTLIITIFV